MTIVLDIDGTLSDHTHRFHFINKLPGEKKDWKSYYEAMGEDPPLFGAQVGVRRIQQAIGMFPGSQLTFVTGRPEEYRELTAGWLLRYFEITAHAPPNPREPFRYPEFPQLHMRPTGDYRSSVTYKEEILKKLWHPMLIIDDDVRNTAMYSHYGIFLKAPECWGVLL
jgi:hypothetical protein